MMARKRDGLLTPQNIGKNRPIKTCKHWGGGVA